MKVIITSGHQIINGKGTGAHGINGFDEAVEARKLVKDVSDHLKKWAKIEVQTDQDSWSLRQVIAWVKGTAGKGDLSIDVHFNAGPAAARGTESFIPEINTKEERELASKLSINIAHCLGTKIRTGKDKLIGVKVSSESQHSRIGILDTPVNPINILLEICFITNHDDVIAYRTRYWKLVQVISDTIYNFSKLKR